MNTETVLEFDADGLPGMIRKINYSGAYASMMGRDGHHCGYVRFPERPVKEDGYYGILTYVPVHGGITYAGEHADGGFVYGFDCAHAGDNQNPDTWDMEWLQAQCVLMKRSIELAAKYEDEYLANESNDYRSELIARYHAELGASFDVRDNFGAMINVLFGQL